MDKKLIPDLKESLNEAIQHASGKLDLRTTPLPRPPKAMERAEIAALREKLNASQAVFARYLNISVKTVQAWEQGLNKPSGAALRLLTIVQKRPEILLEV